MEECFIKISFLGAKTLVRFSSFVGYIGLDQTKYPWPGTRLNMAFCWCLSTNLVPGKDTSSRDSARTPFPGHRYRHLSEQAFKSL